MQASNKKIRALAIHLPQFHAIPENDRWWGKGFTEWTNVKKAKPQFKGHYQPHRPTADLGYYDLSEPKSLIAQATLAKAYSIHGFCFYHYWFNGKKVLEGPLEKMLASGQPDFPFCLCWANENWTRRWDGQDADILLKQDYGFEDDRAHLTYLLPFFRDERYLKVAGKPVFFIYRSELFPDIKKTIQLWRALAWEHQIELYLVRVESFSSHIDPTTIGFDAAMEFQPDWQQLPQRNKPTLFNSLLHHANIRAEAKITHKIFDYPKVVEKMLQKKAVPYKRYPCVVPMWDNTARRKTAATILMNATPAKYEAWLRETVDRFQPYSTEENFIFINAWNEWAEGNHLEPCEKFGLAYLEATKKVLMSHVEG